MRNVLALSAVAVAATLAAWSAPAAAASMLDVNWNEGCGRSTCFNDKGVFTQKWTAKDAMGAITVGKLMLDRSILGNLDSSAFRISFALNGKTIGTWGTYMMGGIAGDELSFTGENFTWNPEDGDLELVLELAREPTAGASGRFFASSLDQPAGDGAKNPGDVTVELPDSGLDEPFKSGPGDQVSAAPEPAAWALMIGGFGMAGAMLRRRARVVA